MTEENRPKMSRHVCLTNRSALTISDDPEYDILCALADRDVLTLARGLSEHEAKSPYPDGLFGLDERATNAAIRKMKSAGLISSRREGDDHVYYLNRGRFKDLADFLYGLIKDS